jgi:hypothetical protein
MNESNITICKTVIVVRVFTLKAPYYALALKNLNLRSARSQWQQSLIFPAGILNAQLLEKVFCCYQE